jgi:amino acid transporter
MTQEERDKREGWALFCFVKMVMNFVMDLMLGFVTFIVFNLPTSHNVKVLYVFINIAALASTIYFIIEFWKAHKASEEV